jgi:hypothetical protein
VPAGDTAARQVRAFTGGRGVDHAFECVGRAETIRSAWSLARRGGSCTILGIGRRDERAEFSAAELVRFARTLRSSIYASSDPDADLPGPAPGGAGRCLRSEPLGDPPGGTRRRARSSGPNATRGGRSHQGSKVSRSADTKLRRYRYLFTPSFHNAAIQASLDFLGRRL